MTTDPHEAIVRTIRALLDEIVDEALADRSEDTLERALTALITVRRIVSGVITEIDDAESR